jgi:hypothetical protein
MTKPPTIEEVIERATRTYDRLRGHEEEARNLHRATRDLHQHGSRERPEHQSGRQPVTLKDCRRYGGQCKEHDPAPRRG